MLINFRSLQNRNFLLFLFALIITVSSVLAVTLQQTYEHSTKQIDAQFDSSYSVLLYRLESEALGLDRGLDAASKNFSLKSLILGGKKDPTSLRVALVNYQSRLNSDFIAVIDQNKQPVVSTLTLEEPMSIGPLNRSLRFGLINGELFLVSIKAIKEVERIPKPNAYIIAGLNVSSLFSSDIKSITNFELSIRYDNKIHASTIDSVPNKELTKAFSEFEPLSGHSKVKNSQSVAFDNSSSISYQSYMGEINDIPLNVFFTLPESKAHLNYDQLILQLSAAIAIIMVLISFLTFSFSKSIAKPLRVLANVANQIRKGEYPLIKHDKSLSEVETLSLALAGMQGAIQKREKENHKLAYFNPLTGLPNRIYFTSQIKKQIEQYEGHTFAVLWMDVDRFKDINDTLGHEFGDEVIKSIAKRLEDNAQRNMFLAYLDGDEFAAYIVIQNEQEAVVAANQIDHLFDTPFIVKDIALDVSISIGVSLYPDDTKVAEKLMQYADIALYESKEQHHSVSRYKDSNNKYSVVRLSLMTELKQAIEDGQLTLNYQPKIDVSTGKVVSVESLVRWKHPEHGFIFPDEFIPLAEQTGNIRHLTHWAIEVALQEHVRLRELGFDIKMAVNISAVDVSDLELPPFVSNLLERYSVAPTSLILEVTESAIMSDPDKAMVALNMLKNMSIRLSIDDFGTGYSSMEQLKRAPVDELKIDKSFVLDLATNKDDLIIVKSITSLAHNLGMTIVAEGVEDNGSLSALKELKVETAQGYFISKPVESAILEEWLQNNAGYFKS
ncbi:EAL domain-containing protein [Psychrosphaera sp.]|nr:EAL domain-containing protein [Psychrosphaera sp.]